MYGGRKSVNQRECVWVRPTFWACPAHVVRGYSGYWSGGSNPACSLLVTPVLHDQEWKRQ